MKDLLKVICLLILVFGFFVLLTKGSSIENETETNSSNIVQHTDGSWTN